MLSKHCTDVFLNRPIMNVGFRNESDGTICRVEGGDNLTRVSINLDHEAIGRSKVSHGLKVTNPIIKLKRSYVVALIFY